MRNIDNLIEIGLKPGEAKVYVALLELGEASVQETAHASGLQRPNCYSLLEELRKKKLATVLVSSRGRRYAAENPKRLKELVTDKLKQFEEVLPILQASFSASPLKPLVRYYEGRESILQLYEEILASGAYDAVYSPEFLLKEMGNLVEYFGKVVSKRKIKMREIITGTVTPSYYKEIFREPLQTIRYLSPDQPTRMEFILFENRLALVAYRPSIHALVIEGSDIIQTMRIFFEQLWNSARKT